MCGRDIHGLVCCVPLNQSLLCTPSGRPVAQHPLRQACGTALPLGSQAHHTLHALHFRTERKGGMTTERTTEKKKKKEKEERPTDKRKNLICTVSPL